MPHFTVIKGGKSEASGSLLLLERMRQERRKAARTYYLDEEMIKAWKRNDQQARNAAGASKKQVILDLDAQDAANLVRLSIIYDKPEISDLVAEWIQEETGRILNLTKANSRKARK